MLRLLTLGFALLVAAPMVGAQDAADFVVRLNRLENQARQLSGQIEQLQFENRQLKQQLQKFQEDTEFRFQERAVGTRSAAPTVTAPPPGGTPPAGRPPRRGDAFDPAAAPDAPGAPRVLGQGPGGPPLPSGALPSDSPTIGSLIDDETTPGTGPLDLGQVSRGPAAAVPPAAPVRPAAPSVAATSPTGDARSDYEAAYAYILQKQYEQAEMGLRQFLQSHPRDRLVPDAMFWLGETYLQRNRHREAAEHFLKVSTDYARSTKAPDAMLKLGVSLNALGARDQACATLAELERKFPQASVAVRQGADREQKRARCTA